MTAVIRRSGRGIEALALRAALAVAVYLITPSSRFCRLRTARPGRALAVAAVMLVITLRLRASARAGSGLS